MKEMILKTKRLLLRELKQDDFDDICKLLQDPIVMYAYEGAFSKKEVQEWLDKQLRRYQNDGFGLWGMIEKGSGELIGQCGLTYQEFNGQQVPEIGYLLRAEYWHKGYATELVRNTPSISLTSTKYTPSYGTQISPLKK